MNAPITLTEKAHGHITAVVARQKAHGIRLSVTKSGCSGLRYHTACFEEPMESDKLFDINGLVVAIDKESQDYLQGMVLDYQTLGPGQMQLIYHNPNATDLCGCGESFRMIDDQTASDR